MKNHVVFLFLAVASFFLSCSSPKKFAAGRTRYIVVGDTSVKDAVEYYETDFEVRQHSDFKRMLGGWDVATMRRQQKAELETLSDVYFELNPDSTFTGKAGCSRMEGRFSVKGTSIKFTPIILTVSLCENADKEDAFIKLLQRTVSEYTYAGDKLLLRDGASNIVFEARRK